MNENPSNYLPILHSATKNRYYFYISSHFSTVKKQSINIQILKQTNFYEGKSENKVPYFIATK
jgi:hypothetical protein